MVLVVALLTAALRLAYLHAPLTPDEGGFLTVARQWRPGPSMYGHYWVDRPPLLIALFRLAADGGGLVALHLLGAIAAALTVLGVGLAARRVGTDRAAGWAAAVASALLVSPMLGTTTVNGELLAAPFVAVGVWLSLEAVRPGGRPRSDWAAVGAGACAVAAVLVKQNMLDVFVFAGVLALLSRRWAHLRMAGRLTTRFTGGGLATAVLVLGYARVRGTSPAAVLFAMYPFRVRATMVAEHTGLAGRLARLASLGTTELLAGGPLVVGALVVVLLAISRAVRRGQRAELGTGWMAAAVATLALAAYGVVSVVAGGSYWTHYLVQLAVPTGLSAGLLVTAVPRLGRRVAAVVLVVASVAWVVGLSYRTETGSLDAGTDVGRVAEPGDTMVSALGDADIVEAAGLSSPYPYLWSLPARTLDPGLHGLRTLLAGPHAPTWLVVRGPGTLATLDTGHGTVPAHYRLVADLCGRSVYLHAGLQRPVPRQLGACSRTLSGGFAPFFDAALTHPSAEWPTTRPR